MKIKDLIVFYESWITFYNKMYEYYMYDKGNYNTARHKSLAEENHMYIDILEGEIERLKEEYDDYDAEFTGNIIIF